MSRLALTLLVLALTACASKSPYMLPPEKPAAQTSAPPPLNPTGKYGQADFKIESDKLLRAAPSVKEVKGNSSAHPVLLKATVKEVCPKKGCWLKVAGKSGDMFVTFKDYGFFVPVDLIGREIALQGNFVVHTETIEEQKHLLEDARRPKNEIDAIKKDRETLRFIATGVKDLSLAP